MENDLAPFCRIPYTITVAYRICLIMKKEQGWDRFEQTLTGMGKCHSAGGGHHCAAVFLRVAHATDGQFHGADHGGLRDRADESFCRHAGAV